MSEVAIIGGGYVGLTTGACLAKKNNFVKIREIDPEKIKQLNNGEVPFFEPGLSEIVTDTLESGHLSVVQDLEEAIDRVDICMLCLPTPKTEGSGADTSRVLSVAHEIGQIMQESETDYMVIATKSTVPPGTAERVRAELLKNADNEQFDVASNPEFLAQGRAVDNFMHPDRMVVGVDSNRAWEKFQSLYLPFFPNRHAHLIRTSIPNAETIKYTSNALLYARVMLVNQIALICEGVGADTREVMEVAGMDNRIGNKFLNPGPGVGGSCFDKDMEALVHVAQELGLDFSIGRAVIEANRRQKTVLPERVKEYLGKDLTGRRVAVLGLSFKPETDDTRESPAFELIDALLEGGAEVQAHDPRATGKMRNDYKDRQVAGKERLRFFEKNELEKALWDVDAAVIVTDWDDYKSLPWTLMASWMRKKIVIDGRDLDGLRESAIKYGFTYDGLGDGRKVKAT